MKIVMVGQGAFGRKHLDGLKNIKDVEVVSLVGGSKESTEAVAKQYGIPHWTTNLGEALARPGVDAAILTSPTQVHASQAIEVMKAGKHVEIEIPIADSLADARKTASQWWLRAREGEDPTTPQRRVESHTLGELRVGGPARADQPEGVGRVRTTGGLAAGRGRDGAVVSVLIAPFSA